MRRLNMKQLTTAKETRTTVSMEQVTNYTGDTVIVKRVKETVDGMFTERITMLKVGEDTYRVQKVSTRIYT